MSVGGLVEHEHGIVDLRGDKQQFFTQSSLSLSFSLSPRGILPDLSPSQVLQGGSATDGQKAGGGEGGRQREGCRRATGYKEEAEGAKTGRYVEKLHNKLTYITGDTKSWKLR